MQQEVERVLVCFWVVLATVGRVRWAAGAAPPKTCRVQIEQCIYDTLNFSTDGLQRLRASEALMRQVNMVSIERLVSPFPDGTLLALLDDYADNVEYEEYHERFLRIPPGCTLEGIYVKNALAMQSISVAAPNLRLQVLQLSGAGLLGLPPSLRNLRALMSLIVEQGLLRTVSLDALAGNVQLNTLMLTFNRVTELVASSDPAAVDLPVTDISFAGNQLEYVDGAFFAPLKKLTFLSLEENRLQRIGGSAVSFPRLSYLHLESNALQQLNASGWNAPRLAELFLDSNNFTQLPAGLERLPKLATLHLSRNRLPAIDLSRLEGWPSLERIDVSGNVLQTVRISKPGRVSLPRVNSINLVSNRLQLLDVSRWNMPELKTVLLAFNELPHLPGQLFAAFPRLQTVNALRNPLRCAGLRALEEQLVQHRLTVDSTAFGQTCPPPGTSFTASNGRTYCCVAQPVLPQGGQ